MIQLRRQGDLFFLNAYSPGIVATIGFNAESAARLRDALTESLDERGEVPLIDFTKIPDNDVVFIG